MKGAPRLSAWRARACRRLAAAARRFRRDERGTLAIYIAFVGAAFIGASVIVFDIGRLTIVRTQMQNAADAAASAAAVQLDGTDGARTRAESVARNAAAQTSAVAMADGSPAIPVAAVSFFQEVDPARVAATNDRNARFVEVDMSTRPVNLVLQPVLALVTAATPETFADLDAASTATSSPIVCDPPPLLVCNPDEQGLEDITQPEAIGKQVLVRYRRNNPAAGNFGLMCPPETPNCGANVVETFLAAERTDECTATTLSTKPGVNFNKVNNGVNSRFDEGSLANPARNIIAYPRDLAFQADLLGNGNWQQSQYWADAHGGAPLPA